MDERETRRRRLRRARILIRSELAVAIAATLAAGLVYVGAPGGPSPMFYRDPLIQEVLPWLGGLGVIVGFVWTGRLTRADPEAGASPWRYRDF